MRGCLISALGTLAIVAFAVGGSLLAPNRNVYGNSQDEVLITQCLSPYDNAVVRLYQGNGGATTALWWSVTFQANPLTQERQVFYSYGSPAISTIACAPDKVTLVTEETSRTALLWSKITDELIYRPIGLYWNEPSSPPIQIRTGVGVFFVSGGVLLACITAWQGLNQIAKRRHLPAL